MPNTKPSPSGAYWGGGALLTVVGVLGIANDNGVFSVLLAVAGGALLLVAAIITAISETNRDGDS